MTKKYIVTAQGSNGVDLKVDVPVIQGVAGGNLVISTLADNSTKIAYEGTVAITVGIQAIRLGFDDHGHITGFKPIAAGGGALGLEPGVTGHPDLVTTPSIFVDLGFREPMKASKQAASKGTN